MKIKCSSFKAIGLTAFLALVTGSAMAQAGVDWQLNGNAAASTNFVGTTNSIPLAFRTVNLERMRIDVNGRVGIGTTAPAGELHVSKSGNGGAFGTTSIFRLQAVNTTASFASDNAYDFRVTSDGFLRLSQLLNGGSLQVLSANVAGNVGIGINNANARLEVANSSRVSWIGSSAKYLEMVHDGTSGYINSTEDLHVNYASGKHLMLGNIGANSANLTVSGKVGVGVASPAASLDVAGNAKITNASGGTALNVSAGTGAGMILTTNHAAGYGYAVQVGATQPYTKALGVFDNSSTPVETFRVYANGRTFINGNVGIGKLEDSGYKLDVAGTIRACEVLVENNGWCDYVFEEDYDLRSIDELEAYVKENKHLPNIPAASVVESEGQSLGDYPKRMMEKIEELSLYVIELNGRVKSLEAENAELKAAEQK